MSTRFEAQPPNPVPLARGSVAAVMEAIGLEIAQWEKGGQSEAEARARIGALVSIGKDPALEERASTMRSTNSRVR